MSHNCTIEAKLWPYH